MVINLLNIKYMKKFVTLLALLFAAILVPMNANARIIGFGVKAGVNINSLHLNKSLEQFVDPSNQAGWTAGLMAELNIPVIGICADVSVMYSRLNYDSATLVMDNGTDVGTEVDDPFCKDFIDIPINLKYKFTLPVISSFAKPYIFTGPQFSFALNRNTLDDISNRKCQTSWNFGLGFEFLSHLQISGSYGLGMNNVAKHFDGFEDVTKVKARNNYWTVTAAYLF